MSIGLPNTSFTLQNQSTSRNLLNILAQNTSNSKLISVAMDEDFKEKKEASRGLLKYVFSWSINDILNKNMYRNKVPDIPLRFSTVADYTNSFGAALIEETHADMFSGITSVSRAPVREILSVKLHKDHEPPSRLLFSMKLRWKKKVKKIPVDENENELHVSDDSEDSDDDGRTSGEEYEPAVGDILALCEVKPRCIDDLNRPKQPYTLALVESGEDWNDTITVSTSRHVEVRETKRDLFGVYLISMTTNLRIRAALSMASEHMPILPRVVNSQPDVDEKCMECLVDEPSNTSVSNTKALVGDYTPDESQTMAIMNCIEISQCTHQNALKLIWGPPGTGKTKTVSIMLYALLKLETKTLICGPTNTSVLQVARKLFELVIEKLEFGCYGLGDIILFGNRKRMNVDKEKGGLLDIFLDHRLQVLRRCFAPETGWVGRLESLIHLLENSMEMYEKYLVEEAELREAQKRAAVIGRAQKKQAKRMERMRKKAERREREKRESIEFTNIEASESDSDDGTNDPEGPEPEPLSYKEFFAKKLKIISADLKFCIENLPTHLPTSTISREVVESMIRGKELLKSLEDILSQNDETSSLVRVVWKVKLKLEVMNCLKEFQNLKDLFPLPEVTSEDEGGIDMFCLSRSLLVFCTASTAARLSTCSFRMLIIDEAAQLKECESLIPLMVSALNHAVLIGDEKQLPAMVKSDIAKNSNFGRSLFQRLVLTGHEKHLLNIQYRMHPSISRFPNKEFYNNQILDAHCVRTRSYERQFLEGKMYGTYSFINVSDGTEECDAGHSLINTMEVAVALAIVSKLSKACSAKRVRTSVGVISPYKAQMYAIQNIFTKRFPVEQQTWCVVNVRSVDGFQGGEDDVIIISTVRSNIRGSIGFLSDHQRTNVALTRARHCLWILGNGRTLSSSDTIWKKLVLEAKNRDAFHNVEDDTGLSQFLTDALLGLGRLDLLLSSNSAAFKHAKWKMCFSDEFVKSMSRDDMSTDIQKSVLELLEKISSGWRENKTFKDVNLPEGSIASDLLQMYKIKGQLYLAWSVDLQEENSNCNQIIKVWDILWPAQVPKLASHLEDLVGNYTVKKLNRCKYNCMEGTVAIPGSWPSEKPCYSGDPSGAFASLSLGENKNINRNSKSKERW